MGFFCTFQLVTGAWGGQGLWSLSDRRNVFRLQIRVFLPIPFREGEWAYWKVSYILGLCFTTVFGICQTVLSSPHSHSLSLGDTSGHSRASLAAGTRASTAGWQSARVVLWALPHWEYCHLNSKVYFGSGEMRVLHRRAVLDQFSPLLCTCEKLQELTSDFCRFASSQKECLPLHSG